MIYLDHHATTPLDPRVLEAMLPYLKECYGNPSSRSHKFGWDAEEAIENARKHIAALINCYPHQIIFTSGATESNNTILKQSFQSIITSSIEHSSIIETCNYLKDKHIELLDVNRGGLIDVDQLKTLPKPDLISVMLVNNEIGTIQDVGRIGNELLQSGTLLHSDMAQALGKISVDVEKLNVDFASFSAHKIYGPKGVGALFVKNFGSIDPLMHGGKQEYGQRAGTLNVPAIAGFGKACEIIKDELEDIRSKLYINAECFLENILQLPGVRHHPFNPRVPGCIHLALPCDDMSFLLGTLANEVAFSIGSACMSINNEPSRVLKAIGLDEEESHRSVRICVGRFNTFEEIRNAAGFIKQAVRTVNAEVKK